MRAALEHDAAFLEEQAYDSASQVKKLKISEALSLSWNSACPEVAEVRTEQVPVGEGQVESRTYVPESDVSDRYILWVHGGGWNEGSLDIYDRLMRVLANSAQCPVVGIGYTKAPFAHFPDQLNELFAFFRFVEERLYPARPKKCVAGYSAGANLIMSALNVYGEDLGSAYFDKVCLVCGVFDCDLESSTHTKYDGYFGNSLERLKSIIENYAPGALVASDQRVFTASSVPCCTQNYLIISAEHDMLRDGAEKLASTLRNGQKTVDYRCIPEMTHIFLQRSAGIKAAHDTIVEMGHYLGR